MKRRKAKLAKTTLRPLLTATVLLSLLLYLLPLAVVLPRAQGAAPVQIAPHAESRPSTSSGGEMKEKEAASEKKQASGGLTLRCLLDGQVQEMELEDYLWGVVAAEMPAGFDQQALCAQAVAARTYTLYRMENPGQNHPQADICGDPGCCQAWMSREQRKQDWAKSERKTCEKKINKAISETRGLTLYYDDAPILAAFHAASAGSTKSALEVWGEDYPYLQEVSSPEGSDMVPNYYSTVSVEAEEFSRLFLAAYPEAKLEGSCGSWFGKMEYDEAGLPVSLSVGQLRVGTGALRSLLGLRSASFSVGCEGDSITFYVTGYGHGVGMSQYGANALAKEGKSFREILEWYYPGTELKEVEG